MSKREIDKCLAEIEQLKKDWRTKPFQMGREFKERCLLNATPKNTK